MADSIQGRVAPICGWSAVANATEVMVDLP